MKVYYDTKMLADIGRHTSPSSMKPKQVLAAMEEIGENILVVPPITATRDDFYRAHDPEFVDGVLSGRIANGFGNRSIDVIKSLPYTSGSLLSGAIDAVKYHTISCSLTSGFHHAGYDFAGGFCTFNGLMVAALYMLEHQKCSRIAIIDCDQHYGNGTEDIIKRKGLSDKILHVSFGEYYHSPKHSEKYLTHMNSLERRFGDFAPDLIIYQAGADSHINDPLGGVLTTEQMYLRDKTMFEYALKLDIPMVYNLAGGYQRDADGGISKVINIHVNTYLAYLNVWHKQENQILGGGNHVSI